MAWPGLLAAVLLIVPLPGQEPPAGGELADRSARIAGDLAAITKYPTRHSLSPHAAEAAAWIEKRFADLGLTEIGRHGFGLRGARCENVEATKQGTDPAAGLILIGAHYDSRMERLGDAEAPAPGADDNASGVAALLEIARSLRDTPTRRTIRFVAFSGEEQGLVGSRAYADRCKQAGLRIDLVVNLDMVGRPIDPGKRQIVVEHDPGLRVLTNDEASRSWANRLAAQVELAGLKVKEGPIFGSDYIPFEAAGYPCVGLFDGADEQPFYHTGDDRPEAVDTGYTARAAGAVIGLILGDEARR